MLVIHVLRILPVNFELTLGDIAYSTHLSKRFLCPAKTEPKTFRIEECTSNCKYRCLNIHSDMLLLEHNMTQKKKKRSVHSQILVQAQAITCV